MSRLRVVLDTNVLISAALKPSGRQALVVELVAFRAVELCVSEAVLAEYREVFHRPKFARLNPKDVSHLLRLIEAEATWSGLRRCWRSPSTIRTTAFTNVPAPPTPTILSLATSETSPSPTRTSGSSTAANCWNWWPPPKAS